MENTKAKILKESLKLFSKKGYEAVSVRDIAAELGISQSALYKHYTNKQDIFDRIIKKMEQRDAEQASAYQMPQDTFDKVGEAYGSVELNEIIKFTFAQFRFWTEDEFAADFRRMLTLEQFRSEKMTALYQQYLSGGIISYTEDLFREIPKVKQVAQDMNMSPKQLAVEFYGPVYMLMNLYDSANDLEKPAITMLVQKHIEDYIRRFE